MPRPYAAAFPTAAAILLLAAIACGSGGTSEAPGGGTPTPEAPAVTFITSSGGTPGLTVEIADTPEERSRGLMFRESLPEDAGMLFVWPEDSGSGFWMKDTLVPLSVAFINSKGNVLDIQDMEPLDETLHHSPEPYRYAVEVNQGWFEEHGIAAGDSMTLPDEAG